MESGAISTQKQTRLLAAWLKPATACGEDLAQGLAALEHRMRLLATSRCLGHTIGRRLTGTWKGQEMAFVACDMPWNRFQVASPLEIPSQTEICERLAFIEPMEWTSCSLDIPWAVITSCSFGCRGRWGYRCRCHSPSSPSLSSPSLLHSAFPFSFWRWCLVHGFADCRR